MLDMSSFGIILLTRHIKEMYFFLLIHVSISTCRIQNKFYVYFCLPEPENLDYKKIPGY